MRLKDKVIIVTGGVRGIGQFYVQVLAKEGARVVVADIEDGEDLVDRIKREGGKAVAVKTDVTDEIATQEMAKTALDTFGRIDVLVNTAGISGLFERIQIE